MTRHACPRCGLEDRTCSHGSWADRHPVAAVTAGLFTLVWMSMMVSIYPGTAAVIITSVAVGGVVYFAVRERRRREALAARADYEHRALMALPKFPALAYQERRRPADHWSITEPIPARQIPRT